MTPSNCESAKPGLPILLQEFLVALNHEFLSSSSDASNKHKYCKINIRGYFKFRELRTFPLLICTINSNKCA